MRRAWIWLFGILSGAAGACGAAGRLIIDTVGLANMPADTESALGVFRAALLWLASTGPVGAYVTSAAFLVIGLAVISFQMYQSARIRNAERFSDRAGLAIAIQSAMSAEVPLIGELGSFVRSEVRICYDRALDFVRLVDRLMEEHGKTYFSQPNDLWLAVSNLLIKPVLSGSALRSLASPSFPTHGTLYLFQHQLYDELERYNTVMSMVMRIATDEILPFDANGKEYRLWTEADTDMRRKFIELSTRSEFPELCNLVTHKWGEKERQEWDQWISSRVSAASLQERRSAGGKNDQPEGS